MPAGKRAGSLLLAEDSAIYRHLIEGHLKEWGFDFECVRDGKEAWKLLMQAGTRPDWLCLTGSFPKLMALSFAVGCAADRRMNPTLTRSC